MPPNAAAWLPAQMVAHRFTELPVTIQHALAGERLPWHNRDPFDRLLVAQATVEGLAIVTGDPQLALYGIPVIRC